MRETVPAEPHAWAGAARTVSVLAALALVLAACGSTALPAARSSTPAPAGLPAFYSVPEPLPKAPHGQLLKSERVAAPGVHGTAYRVMYLSRSELGAPVAVTGLVYVPNGSAPPGGRDVVTWGHGTNGMADQCAPSLDPTDAVPLLNDLLDRNWVVTASDYQGEGTPGLLPYLAGTSAGQNTLDIVRVARQIPFAHAGSHFAVWGHSEGGQTALFAQSLAAGYVPELDLEGVVAGAPPSQFNLVYQFLKDSPYRYYLFMAAAGFNVAYGDEAAPLGEILTPEGMSLLPLLEQGCAGFLAARTASIPTDQIAKGDPFQVPAWRTLLHDNDPANLFVTKWPMLIIQGGADEQIPPASTALLAKALCSRGQDVERWIYPGRSHSGVIPVSAADMTRWISDRFAGEKAADPFRPAGQPDIQVTRCLHGQMG